MSFGDDLGAQIAKAARLEILKALASENDGRLNDILLQKRLDAFGYKRGRDWVKTQLNALADLGAVSLTDAGAMVVARIERPGRDHLDERSVLSGVSRPHEVE